MMTELLELSNSGIHVAQYLTEYVPKEILEQNATKKYEDELWSEQTEEQSGNNKNDWNNNIGEQFRRL